MPQVDPDLLVRVHLRLSGPAPSTERDVRLRLNPEDRQRAGAALHKAASVDDCRIIDLPKISDPRGNLTVVEAGWTVPFDVARVYWLYDVPGGASRAGHAHHELQQLLVAASGSFEVTVDDARRKKTFFMNRSYSGLYIPPGIWREIHDFSSGSVCLSLASLHYDEDDYVRDYEVFLAHAS